MTVRESGRILWPMYSLRPTSPDHARYAAAQRRLVDLAHDLACSVPADARFAVTFCYNRNASLITPERAEADVRHALQRANRQLLGRNWHRHPERQLRGLFAVEGLDLGNVHVHGALWHGVQPIPTLTLLSSILDGEWCSATDYAGDARVKPYQDQGWAEYTMKWTAHPRYEERLFIF